MIEKIYTIPVNEVFTAKPCSCPLCAMKERFEQDRIDYVLGPALMEPDVRTATNEKGFCPRHYAMLFNSHKNSVGLGLLTNTYIETVQKKLSGGMRHRSDKDLAAALEKMNSSCFICDQLNFTMDRYIDVIYWQYANDKDFRQLFREQDGFCLEHFRQLCARAKKALPGKMKGEFMNDLCNVQSRKLAELQEDVDWFTKKFDYRYKDEPWNNSKDAVQRSIQFLKGKVELN